MPPTENHRTNGKPSSDDLAKTPDSRDNRPEQPARRTRPASFRMKAGRWFVSFFDFEGEGSDEKEVWKAASDAQRTIRVVMYVIAIVSLFTFLTVVFSGRDNNQPQQPPTEQAE